MKKIDDKSAMQFALEKLEAGDVSDFDAAKMEGFLDMIKSVMSIDKEIVEILKEQFADTLIKKAELMEAMKTVENGSVIVYFKSAQLFKIYKKDDIETLLGGQLKTLYRNVGLTYEVIPNNSEQKIIMIGNGSVVNNIEKIKSYVVSFMRDKGIKEIEEKDITCYENQIAREVHIILPKFSVRNSEESVKLVHNFKRFISYKEGNDEVARMIHIPTYSPFPNTTLYPLYSSFTDLQNFNISDILVGHTETCKCLYFDKTERKIISLPDNNQYVYLLRTSEHINLKQNIYKIGMTERPFRERLREYKNCELIEVCKVANAAKVERRIKQEFNSKFKKHGSPNSEYYEAELGDILELFRKIVSENRIEC